MADKVLFQTDDALSETNLAMWRARDNSTDYVERGLEVTPDWANATFDITAGHAVLKDGAKAYDVFADARSGLSLADSKGMNYVFLVMDSANQNAVQFVVNADKSQPSKPSLLVQTLDANAQSSSPVNRQPKAKFDSLGTGELKTDSQTGVADTFVTDTSELESAFAGLSAGETVRIAQPDEPYRPSGWLDIDTSRVTVIAETPFARDGQPLIKPADGSDVGGIRVGHNASAEHVHVEGIGFHGNTNNMSDSAKRLHGFVADNKASHVTFRDNVVTRTHPYSEHDSGGSGFTVRKGATNVEIVDNLTDDIGNHGIQVAGTDISVRENVLTDGFGHSIALNVTHPGGTSYVAKNVSVVDNFGRNDQASRNAEGSFVGFEGSKQRSERGYFSILGNLATGQHRKLAQLANTRMDIKAISVVGNVGDGQNSDHAGIKSAVKSEDSWVNISNNVLLGYSYGGIRVTKGNNVNIVNNLVADVGSPGTTHEDGIRTTGYANHNVVGNIVQGAQGIGVRVQNQLGSATVAQNQVRWCGKQGIVVNQGGSSGDRGALVTGNALAENDRGNGGVPELDVRTDNVLAVGNLVSIRGQSASASFSDAGSNNLWVGNMAPADGSAWSIGSASGARTMANRPNPAGKGVVLTSPNGTEYEVTVADDGTLNTTQL
ncbi:right-handed parallel beta-helix repeat-containing protein [Halorussus lipolyticus]|uniref:right-handed parallel beta-helix repeat-containing protein n=1 Tax=Halorussus lipolyticus TaxID=3034024 RepID=UPI0023E77D8D|nr:right-handed parallel beta-helix repeat-containing protein [Halorussus sp. DT80]